MPYAQIDTDALSHPKVLALSDAAFRVWVAGLAYCQAHLTDGEIPEIALRALGVRVTKKHVEELIAGRLWERRDDTLVVHDYLQWNASRAEVQERAEHARRRSALARDQALRQAVRDRDGDRCRYCGGSVAWNDRRGPRGGTYDHVDPAGPNSANNLVVACRLCNSQKGARTPEQARMPLIPLESDLDREPESDSDRGSGSVQARESKTHHCVRVAYSNGSGPPEGEREGERGGPPLGHQQHVFCGRRFCVPRWLDVEFRAGLGSEALERYDLDAWYAALDAEMVESGAPLLPDPKRWLQDRYREVLRDTFGGPRRAMRRVR